jgi:hypothetical protein
MKTVDYTKRKAGAVVERYRWMDAEGKHHVTITRLGTCPKCGRTARPMEVGAGITEYLHRENQTMAGWPVDGTVACFVVPKTEAAR